MANGYVPGEMLEAVKGRDIQSFMQTQAAATQAGAVAGQAITQAVALRQNAQQFLAREKRLEAMSATEALLALLGMKSRERLAGMARGSAENILGYLKEQRAAYERLQDTQAVEAEMREKLPRTLDDRLDKEIQKYHNNVAVNTDESLAENTFMSMEWRGLPIQDDKDGRKRFNNTWTPRELLGGRGIVGKVLAPAMMFLRYIKPAYTTAPLRASKVLQLSINDEGLDLMRTAIDKTGEYTNMVVEDGVTLDISDSWGRVHSMGTMRNVTEQLLNDIHKRLIEKPFTERDERWKYSMGLLRAIGDFNGAAKEYCLSQVYPDKSQTEGRAGIVQNLLASEGIMWEPVPVIDQPTRNLLEMVSSEEYPARYGHEIARQVTGMWLPQGPEMQQLQMTLNQIMAETLPGSSMESNILTLDRIEEKQGAESGAFLEVYRQSGQVLIDALSERGIPNTLQNQFFSGYDDQNYKDTKSYIDNQLLDIANYQLAGTDESLDLSRQRADELQLYIMEDIPTVSEDQTEVLRNIVRDLFRVLQTYGVYSVDEKPTIGWATLGVPSERTE